MSTASITTDLRKLASQGNYLAELLVPLYETEYPDDLEGYKTAIEHGRQIMDKLSQEPTRLGNLIGKATQLAHITPGRLAPLGPGPIGSAMVLGSLGVGAGHLGASLVNKLRGSNERDSERLKRTSRIIGGLAGLVPAAGLVAMNVAAGKNPVGNVNWMYSKKVGEEAVYEKVASVIPVDMFQEMIWNDPDVAHRLPTSMTGAASALIEGAQRTGSSRSTGLPFVTPVDVARMAVGLGSGYASGLLVGKALGGLFGVSDQSQKILRQSGAAAGLLRSVVPLAYGAY